jgi:hypothetical protein
MSFLAGSDRSSLRIDEHRFGTQTGCQDGLSSLRRPEQRRGFGKAVMPAGSVRSFIRQDRESGISTSTYDLDSGRIRSMAMPDSIELAAEVVAAYVSNNPLPKGDLPDLILAVHSSLARLESEPEHAQPQVEAKPPAVPIRRSVTPE